MNKKKFVVLALMMIAVIALSSCLFVACDKDSDNDTDSTTETIKETEGLLISNGDFKVIDTTSDTYPRKVTSWTGAKMYSSGNYKDDVTAGVISLDKTLYDANKSSWDDSNDELYNKLIAGGKYGDADEIKNALMIYMPEETTNSDGKKVHGPTAYGYTSSSFTLAKGAYYRLTVDVLTYNIGGSNEADRGARIYVSSNTYAEFDSIDTKGEWKTYEIIIESSPSSTTTLSVMLGLGKYSNSYTTGLTTGYAVFDNLSLTKLEEGGEEAYNAAVSKEKLDDEYTATATLKVSNGRFDFGTTTISASGTPNGWSLVTGNSGETDSAPTSLGFNGIIDVKNFADSFEQYSSTYSMKSDATSQSEDYVPAKGLDGIKDTIINRDGKVGTNVFMLSQQLMTAQGIKASRSITIEKNKTYDLAIDIYTYAIHGAGVTLTLTGSDGKDITIKGISKNSSGNALIGNKVIDSDGYDTGDTDNGASTNGWTTYHFYIKGNQFRDYSYTMTIWLGTEGTNSNKAFTYKNVASSKNEDKTTYTANGTFSTGWVFIDELTLQETSLPNAGDTILGKNDEQTLDISENASKTGLIVDLTTDNSTFEGWLTGSSSTTNEAVSIIGSGAPNGWSSNYKTDDLSNPIIKDFISEGIVDLTDEESFNGIGTYPQLPYKTANKSAYQLYASQDSYYEIESQSFVIEKNKYYRISVWVKTIDVKSTSGAYLYLINRDDEDATLTSFTQINTNDEDGFDEYLNDWCELTLYVRGAQNEDTSVAFKLTLGTGNRWASDTLTSGSMFVTNINGTTIDYSTYNGASTGTYVKSVNLSASSASLTFTNGTFDEYDLSDDKLAPSTALNEQGIAAAPSSWTFSDKTLDANTDKSSLVAGVIALDVENDGTSFKGSTQTGAALSNVDFNDFYPSFDSLSGESYEVLPGEKGRLLAIGSTDTTGYAAGYASQSKTLSANSYYTLTVWAKSVNGATGSIYLTGESFVAGGINSTFTVTEGTSLNGWTKYTYYLATGQNSVSITLNLWLGQNIKYVDLDEDAAKSTGAVFFDNIVYNTIDEAKFNDAAVNDTTPNAKKLSFNTDSFDALSSSTESRKSLTTSVTGWTGTIGTNQSSSNTASGIIYADSNYLESKTDKDGAEYISILGKTYDATSSDDEIVPSEEDAKGMTDDEIAAYKENKVEELRKANWLLKSELDAIGAHSGNQMLVINNYKESMYTYTSSTMTLKEDCYYQISVWVNTLKLNGNEGDDKIGANIELYLGSANESDNPLAFNAISTNGDWTEYRFYVKAVDDDVTSVTVKLSLGRYIVDEDDDDVINGLTRGYAFFDDVSVKLVDETVYDEAVTEAESNDKVLTRLASNELAGKGDEDDTSEDDDTSTSGFNTEALWWMVPTIVLAVLIIVVVVIFIVRKVRKPVAKKKEKKVASIKETPSLDAKHDKYDENKE